MHSLFCNIISNVQEVAVKLEPIKSVQPLLRFESNVLKYLNGGVGIPRHRWYGTYGNFNVMVMDLLGPTIEQLLEFCNRSLSVKSVLMVADQLISVMEYVHQKHIIHRDIKPDNILFGMDFNKHRLFLIDFGLAKKYRSSQTGQHIPFR